MHHRSRVAIFGASFARTAYLPALRHVPEAEVVAIASARADSAAAVAREFGVPYASDDWQATLADVAPDVVIVATPTDLHEPMTMAALEAGAHVICEKPFAMDVEGACAMRDRAAQLGRVGVVGHVLRFDPNRRAIRDLIHAGTLGTVHHVHVTLVRPGWASRDGRREGDWRALAQHGGGLLGALGSHQLDLLRWWFGTPERIFAQLLTMQPDRVDPVTGTPWTATADDVVHLVTQHATCSHADVRISGVSRHPLEESTIVVGSEGTVIVRHGTRETLHLARGTGGFDDITVDDPDEHRTGLAPGSWSAHVLRMLRETFRAVRDGHGVFEGATFDDAVVTQRAMAAAHASQASGRWISWEDEVVHT